MHQFRPFTCHRYLCSRLEKEVIRKEPDLSKRLGQKFWILEDLRGRLWREYLETPLQPNERKNKRHVSQGRTKIRKIGDT